MLTKSNRTEIHTYKVEERTFGTPCSIVSKANKMLGLISRTCRGFADVNTTLLFFLSQLEHGSVVWSPYTQQNIDMIEHAQRRASIMPPE